jgi:hypothetical protein
MKLNETFSSTENPVWQILSFSAKQFTRKKTTVERLSKRLYPVSKKLFTREIFAE